MFIHLHGHSHYSLLEGLGKPANILEKAKSLDMNAIAITDYGAMFGGIEFYKLAKKFGIKAILGVDLIIVPNISKKENNEKQIYITLLAKNFEGYENLLKIISIANLQGANPKPRIDLNTIQQNCNGLIAFMGGENSPIGQMILANESENKIIDLIGLYKQIFGEDNFLLEIIAQDYNLNPNIRVINNNIFDLASKSNTKTIVNNNYHYINQTDKQALDVAGCIKDGILFYDQNRKKIVGDFHIMSEEEIINILKQNGLDAEKINSLIQNNNQIAESIDINIPLGEILFPVYESPNDIKELYEQNKENLETE